LCFNPSTKGEENEEETVVGCCLAGIAHGPAGMFDDVAVPTGSRQSGKSGDGHREGEPAVIMMVDKNGGIFFKDEKGENFGLCRLPGTEAKDSDLPVCKVSGHKMTVKGMRAIPILESEGSGCVFLGPDINGHYWQYCW
jgi:hypothetical protein